MVIFNKNKVYLMLIVEYKGLFDKKYTPKNYGCVALRIKVKRKAYLKQKYCKI